MMIDKLYNTSFVKQTSVNLKGRLNRYTVLTIAIQRMSNFTRYCVVVNCSNKVNLAIGWSIQPRFRVYWHILSERVHTTRNLLRDYKEVCEDFQSNDLHTRITQYRRRNFFIWVKIWSMLGFFAVSFMPTAFILKQQSRN